MKMKTVPTLALLTLAAFGTPAQAINAAQQQAIEHLGELNGTALQCGYFDQTKRLKEAMVANVPKVRALGALFEEATDRSFMNNVQNKRPCPAPQQLSQAVSEGIEALRDAFTGN
ncbi:MAG: hypothetical protein Kow006_16500 [Gammaproteobacteria bacterium]